MSRIRTTKPEFWTNDQVMDCSIEARLLFIGMWNFCDDSGVHRDSMGRLKAEIFPLDDIDVTPMVEELIAVDLVARYEVRGKGYLKVTGWDAHQFIRKPTYRYPLEDGVTPINASQVQHSDSTSTAQKEKKPQTPAKKSRTLYQELTGGAEPVQHSDSTSTALGQHSDSRSNTGNGKERNGKDKAEGGSSPPRAKGIPRGAPDNFHEIGAEVLRLVGNPRLLNYTDSLRAWLKMNADPERDIYPTIKRLVKTMTNLPSSLKYFDDAIAENAHGPRRRRPGGLHNPNEYIPEENPIVRARDADFAKFREEYCKEHNVETVPEGNVDQWLADWVTPPDLLKAALARGKT